MAQENKFFADGMQNLTLRLGSRMQDLRYTVEPFLTDRTAELEYLFAQNWVAQKICSKRSNDMTRRWRTVSSNDLDATQIEAIEAVERKLKLQTTLNKALTWASLYGGVGLLIVTDEAVDKPLAANETIRKIIILTPKEIAATGLVNDDVMSEKFGQYESYLVNNKLEVHASRLIILNAIERPFFDYHIFGLSDLEPLYQALKRFDAMSANVSDLVTESKIDIFKVDGLTNALSAGRENDIASAFCHIQAIKSSTNSLLLDSQNEYEQKELGFAGLKDLLVEFRNAVAGAADMPVTILFGQSASGFASGQEDIDNYHESIHSLQESRLRPVFEVLDPLICNTALGFQPTDWWFEFNSLSELNIEQKTNVLNVFASATQTLIQNGIVDESQVASELKQSGLFANIGAHDLEFMEELENASESNTSHQSEISEEAQAA